MLVDLKVKNFVLIEELEINFNQGLNVLTGETGAGKSIIIGALDMLLGSRASSDVIRKGKEIAYIEAAYEPENLNEINNILKNSGIEPDPDILLLSREIKKNGRNRSRINGQLATLNMIKKISKYLVDIHGQHEHQSLLNPGEHLEILDEFIGENIKEIKKKIFDKFNKINKIDEQLQDMQIDEAEKARQLDMLKFQINEIEEANLQENELKELKQESKKLSNLEEIYEITGEFLNDLNGNDYDSSVSLLDKFGKFMRKFESIQEYDEQLKDFYQQIENVFYQLQDLGFEIQNYHDNSIEFNQDKLDKINNRIDQIQSLQKKYGNTISEIINYKEKMVKKRDKLESREKQISELNKKKKKLKQKYQEMAEKLSEIRKEYALKLEENIKTQFQDLAMEDTILKIDFSRKDFGKNGIDRVQFLISTNPGEKPDSLNKIASGGELSRIMLALKTIIADIDKVDTLIFDEVDSGVGGKTAQKMAEKLTIISQNRQVICITHLPQIASMADTHYFITKKSTETSAFTHIYKLNQDRKKQELARMLGGVKTTDTTYKHAAEMLKMAEEKKEILSD